MTTITLGDRSFETPIFVPSVSSFETQLKPRDALRLQYTMREPISLVSAYDVSLEQELIPLCKAFRNHGVLLLDSGGYETQRIARYAPEHDRASRWNFDKYAKLASQDIYDFIFSYDYFLNEREPVSDFIPRIIAEFRNHANVLDITKLIPVIHLQTLDGKRILEDNEVSEIFAAVATAIDCLFVAVPERELGVGLPSRARLTRKIVSTIKQNSSDCHLHILGCGNLLSFTALAMAGVTMCDGLEWCRTLAADNFHLHHFQQKDLFVDRDYYKGNLVAEFIIESGRPNYASTVAVRNLLSFQSFTRSLQDRLTQHNVEAFIRELFGDRAGDAIQALAS